MQSEDLFEEELFRTVRVRELQNEDFLLNTVERIVLKAEGCSVVLFYIRENPESRGLREIWNTLSERFAGVNFFAVNASLRIQIMQAFQQVNDDPDHPLSQYRIRGFPTILVYREGGQAGISWPKAFYNGQLNSDDIQDWILQLACTPGYTETPALREGVVTDNEVTVSKNSGIARKTKKTLSSADEIKPEELDETFDLKDVQSGDFRIDEAVVDSNLAFQEEFEEEVVEESKLEELRAARPMPNSNIRSFSTTDYPGSLDYADPGWLAQLEDQKLGIPE